MKMVKSTLAVLTTAAVFGVSGSPTPAPPWML